ncbi:MAG: GTPase ObgE [Bacteroidota bacterium]
MSGSNFIDYVKIFCHSGHGGAGSPHLKRIKYNAKAGPDGGDGGRGGHVIIEGNPQLWTLLHLKFTKHVVAKDGEKGSKNLCSGSDAEDRTIEVPMGTVMRDAETKEILFEITPENPKQILFKGGRGGQGNDHFKTAINRTPRYAQPGEDGKEGWIICELKLLADVGLVGFPNAGKSTLLSVISAAKPKIADYPFTTLVPNLGMVSYRDHKSFVVADIPGIIEGAHEGKGLGLRFLRHIERNSILLFMIPADSENVAKEYKILLRELELYNPDLLDKERVLAITKCDLVNEKTIAKLQKKLPGIPAIFISSITGMGITELKDMLWMKMNM